MASQRHKSNTVSTGLSGLAPDAATDTPASMGTSVAASTPPNPDNISFLEQDKIGPLLARANLFRMRGQWDEAVAVCTEALRKVPESPTACSLLGDIYEAQGKYDDALQWFGMAVEFNPNNKADRVKLDRVVDIQRRALLKEEKEAQARAQQIPPPVKKVDPANRTLQWFDRAFPPGKQETVARFIMLIGVVMFLLLISTALFVQFSNSDNRSPNRPIELPNSPGTIVVAPPRTASPPAPVNPVPDNPVDEKPAPQPVDPAPSTPAMAPGDNALLTALRSNVPAGVDITSAQVDPRTAQIRLDIVQPGQVVWGQERKRLIRFVNGFCAQQRRSSAPPRPPPHRLKALRSESSYETPLQIKPI